jgi:hypothetical protein
MWEILKRFGVKMPEKPEKKPKENIIEQILDRCQEIKRIVEEDRNRIDRVERLVESVMDTVNETMTIVSRIEQKEDEELAILNEQPPPIPTGGVIRQIS